MQRTAGGRGRAAAKRRARLPTGRVRAGGGPDTLASDAPFSPARSPSLAPPRRPRRYLMRPHPMWWLVLAGLTATPAWSRVDLAPRFGFERVDSAAVLRQYNLVPGGPEGTTVLDSVTVH